jgi:hypothetical protein
MRRTVTYCPAWWANSSRSPDGISTVTHAASSATGSTAATFRGWKLNMHEHQMHLKYSKGSRQARQRCSALQGVEPNSLTQSVSVE